MNNHLYLKGRLVYSFGKNGSGLSDEFGIIDQIVKLFSRDNFITIHKTNIDQCDDLYDLVFDILPNEDGNFLFKDNEKNLET